MIKIGEITISPSKIIALGINYLDHIEETGLEVKVKNILETLYHSYPGKNVLILLYSCKYISGEAQSIDCHDFKWVAPSQLRQYNFVEPDRHFIQNINNYSL